MIMDPAPALEEQRSGNGEDWEFDSQITETRKDLLDDDETQSMLSHATEDASSPIEHTCRTKGTGMRDQQLNATEHTLALPASLLSKCARERERLWISRAAVVIGFVVIGFLGVDLLPSFTHSVRRHMEVLHKSYPPIVAAPPPQVSNVMWSPKVEPLQKNLSRPQRLMDCVTKGKFYNGTWVHNPNKSRPELLYKVNEVGQKEALFRKGDLARRADVMLEYNQYDWVPSDPACEMADWTIPGVCRLLERTNVSSILFVGDSITFQNTQSFYKMAGGLHNLKQWDQTQRSNICGDILPRPIQLRYVRNDMLYTGTRPREWGLDFPEIADGGRRKEDAIDLLFVNTGAHIHDFTFYKLVIQRAVEYLKANYRGKLIFRTSVPGHSQCNDWFRPLESEEEIVPYNEEELSKFTWQYLERFNKYAAEMFESIGAEIAYPDRILKLRADGHLQKSDCLHYRLPGPPDWNAKVWHNVWLNKYANLTQEDKVQT